MNTITATCFLSFTLMLGCSKERSASPNRTDDSASQTQPTHDPETQNAMRHGTKVNYIFTEDLDFHEIKLIDIDGNQIHSTNNKAILDEIVQSISGECPTSVMDIELPADILETYVTVKLIHVSPTNNLVLRYDQGYIEKQGTPSDGMCICGHRSALGKFIHQQAQCHDITTRCTRIPVCS